MAEFIRLAPPNCWTCQGFCVDPDDRKHRIVEGRTRFYCSKECQWMDESNPGRYTGDRNFFDRYDGWELSTIIRDLGYLRADGKTLIGQPHLNTEGMWTIDDIRELNLVVESPNIRLARELGLPTGDHSGLPVQGDGSVPLAHAHSDLLTGATL